MVSFAEYLAIKAVSASDLKQIRISPRHYWRMRQLGDQDSDTLREGRACHTAILEPDRFLRDYVLWDGDRRAGKTWEAFKVAAGKRTILTQAQYDKALAMRDAARTHPVAGPLLKRLTDSEVPLQWTHPRTGTACKGRMDGIGERLLLDIKSAHDIRPHAFAAAAYRLGYHLQLAWYSDGLVATGRELETVKILVVQSKEPFDVAVYDFGTQAHKRGVDEYEAALDTLLACRASNVWPGIADEGEIDFQLPAWSQPHDDAELTFGGEPLAWGEE